ncbi:MAG TPA: dCTP deaminase [Terriglobales bacterium]|nr:dCTP deaminase [Terriglobales bacterium]
MPLSDVEIRREIKGGKFRIAPFDDEMLQPASYDLKVGKFAATAPRNGDNPVIDLEAERVLVVLGYAPAVIYTLEELDLPLNIAGRFGIKSSLSRRGLFASVGTQVDPGFQGPLSVSLMNMTPNAVALNYGESFVTLELEWLKTPASKGYSGEYQNRKSPTAQELEAVLGYKGRGLSDVVQGFSDLREAVESVANLSKKFDKFLGDYAEQNRESSEFNRALLREMRNLVEHILGERVQTVVLRSVPRDQAKKEILDLYRQSKTPLFYSDVAERLSLDLETVLELCTELENEGEIGVLNQHEPKGTKKISE